MAARAVPPWGSITTTLRRWVSESSISDAGVIKRLADVHLGVTPITGALSAALDRYHHYQPRLQLALDKVKKGSHEWFAKPILDSYHTVWMELHEDLLSTLRIERASEDA